MMYDALPKSVTCPIPLQLYNYVQICNVLCFLQKETGDSEVIGNGSSTSSKDSVGYQLRSRTNGTSNGKHLGSGTTNGEVHQNGALNDVNQNKVKDDLHDEHNKEQKKESNIHVCDIEFCIVIFQRI